MSEMHDFVDIRIIRDDHEVTSGRYKLPVTIGRFIQNSICLGDSPPDKTISRVHAQIELHEEHLRLIDHSSNGTRYHGRLLKNGQSVDIADDDSFEIRDYRILVSRAIPDPTIPAVFEAHILMKGRPAGKPLIIGEMLILCISTLQGLRFDWIPTTGDMQFGAIFARHRLDSEHPVAAVVAINEQGYLLISTGERLVPIAVNRKVVTVPKSRLLPRDVLQIGEARVELHPPNEKSLRCPNPSCGLLNPFDPGLPCRFCSSRLVSRLA